MTERIPSLFRFKFIYKPYQNITAYCLLKINQNIVGQFFNSNIQSEMHFYHYYLLLDHRNLL